MRSRDRTEAEIKTFWIEKLKDLNKNGVVDFQFADMEIKQKSNYITRCIVGTKELNEYTKDELNIIRSHVFRYGVTSIIGINQDRDFQLDLIDNRLKEYE